MHRMCFSGRLVNLLNLYVFSHRSQVSQGSENYVFESLTKHCRMLIKTELSHCTSSFFYIFSTSTIQLKQLASVHLQLAIGIILICNGNSNDAYTTLSQNLIGCSTLSQEYCKLIGWYKKTMWRQTLYINMPYYSFNIIYYIHNSSK